MKVKLVHSYLFLSIVLLVTSTGCSHPTEPETIDTQNPTVFVTYPPNGATVSGTIIIKADATDNNEVEKVEFYIDGTLKSIDASSPYEYSWNSTTYTNTLHTIMAKAHDAANNAGSSSVITVNVNNGGATGTINVTTPSSSTVWTKGDLNVPISWNTGNLGGNVEITLYKSSSPVATIIYSTSNDGSYNNYDVPTSLTGGTDYRIRVYYDDSHYDYSDDFEIKNIVHEVNYPNCPSGPEYGFIGQSYTYSTGGSYCSEGHPVQYRFVWGTGETSPWSHSTSASHSWSRTGSFYVGAQARCAVDTTVVSDWSLSVLVVHIEDISGPDISLSGYSHDFGDNVILQDHTDWTVYFYNNGTEDLEIYKESWDGLGGTQFSVSEYWGTTMVIPPGQNYSLIFRFSPSVVGYHEAILEIQSNDPDESSVTLHLYGNGIQ